MPVKRLGRKLNVYRDSLLHLKFLSAPHAVETFSKQCLPLSQSGALSLSSLSLWLLPPRLVALLPILLHPQTLAQRARNMPSLPTLQLVTLSRCPSLQLLRLQTSPR